MELKAEICAIREAAERAGFNEARIYFETPYLQCSDPIHFEFSVLSGLASVQVPVQPEPTTIRFVAKCGIYQTGDVAGFSEADAQSYIAAGLAERVAPGSMQ